MSIEITTLANGLRIVTEPMPGLQSATVGIWVAAGARHERPEENGIAHFLEHMAFKGTHRRSALQIAEEIEDVGGYMNAYTSREATAYYARVLEGDVGLAIDVIADILLDPLFEPGDIEVERNVILQEIGQTLDTPDDVIFDWLQECAFRDQPLGRSILGPPERVRGFARDDLAGFVSTHYAPGAMVLAAAGAVDHDRIVAQAEALFGGLRARPVPAPAPARFTGGETRHDKPLEQAHFALAFEAPGVRDPAFYTAQLLAGAMGGGMSSRLFQEIRERRGLCYTIQAHAGGYADTGLMTVYAGSSAEDLPALAALTIDELRRAADDMSAAELERARTQMKAGLLMGLESSSARTERLARMIQVWGRVPGIGEIIGRIDSVGLDDLRAFAGEMVSGAGAALALYGPVATAPGLEELDQRRAA